LQYLDAFDPDCLAGLLPEGPGMADDSGSFYDLDFEPFLEIRRAANEGEPSAQHWAGDHYRKAGAHFHPVAQPVYGPFDFQRPRHQQDTQPKPNASARLAPLLVPVLPAVPKFRLTDLVIVPAHAPLPRLDSMTPLEVELKALRLSSLRPPPPRPPEKRLPEKRPAGQRAPSGQRAPLQQRPPGPQPPKPRPPSRRPSDATSLRPTRRIPQEPEAGSRPRPTQRTAQKPDVNSAPAHKAAVEPPRPTVDVANKAVAPPPSWQRHSIILAQARARFHRFTPAALGISALIALGPIATSVFESPGAQMAATTQTTAPAGDAIAPGVTEMLQAHPAGNSTTTTITVAPAPSTTTTARPATTTTTSKPKAKVAATAPSYSPVGNTAKCSTSKSAAEACWGGLISQYSWNYQTAVNVMWCESSGNPNARNPHSTATGLFQILNGPTDPVANVRLAAQMYAARGWEPWVCKG
jgi:hypothetical protein